jgi:Rrf2 family protein
MRVPMKVDYGVRALVDLAQHADGPPVRTAEIASRQSIPEPYLDQLLTSLNKFGFIRSRRGPHGGHVLAKAPEEVNLGMVISILEGNKPLLDCIQEPAECTLTANCSQRGVWQEVEDAIQNILRRTTLADLASRQRVPVAQAVR